MALNLAGQKFGNLLVVKVVPDRKRGRIFWECLCDCGNTCEVCGTNLKSGHTKSCGCKKKVNLSGKVFGKLKAVKPLDYYIRGAVAWECVCECGNTHIASASKLKSGEIKSCGCTKRPGVNHFRWKGGIRRYEKIWVACPDCGYERKVLFKNAQKENHTKRCRACSIRHEAQELSGEKHYNWKGGVTPENERIRKSAEYAEWRERVVQKYGFKCAACGKKSGDMHAHHIISFGISEEARLDISNGIVLCARCHRDFHSRYGMQNDRAQLQEFISIIAEQSGQTGFKQISL